jgi:hypothetical protein
MINRRFVKEALRSTWELDKSADMTTFEPPVDQSCETSTLIFDIFGGEILKTHNKKGWHFYNRINGKRIDFTGSKTGKSSGTKRLEDIPSTPDETYNYFEKEDYLTFFIRFIRAFEEAVGLKKYRSFTS